MVSAVEGYAVSGPHTMLVAQAVRYRIDTLFKAFKSRCLSRLSIVKGSAIRKIDGVAGQLLADEPLSKGSLDVGTCIFHSFSLLHPLFAGLIPQPALANSCHPV